MIKLIFFCGIVFFNFFLLMIHYYDKCLDRKLPEHLNYDFIVVGSGSAGCQIASHLKGKILLVEAGSSGNNFVFNIPVLQPLFQRTKFDWNFVTIAQKNACLALNEQRSHWPMGKIKGGTHRINNLVYHRGDPVDYEDLVSDADMFFQLSEKNHKVGRTKFKSIVGQAFVEAGRELGFDDFHLTNLTQSDGWRYTCADHLDNLENPPEFVYNAFVTRVLFDEKKKHSQIAIGIELEKFGRLHQVFANKIVLSAGTVGSAKILMLSGIGPKNHLNDIGIEVRVDLPVGQNLQDHVTTGLDLVILNRTVGLEISDLMNPFKVFDFLLFNGEESPLAFAGSDSMGFVKINQSALGPDLSFMMLPVGLTSDHGFHLRKVMNLKNDVWENHFMPLLHQTTVSILPILLHPQSKGYIVLVDKDHSKPPLINPNYLSHPDDIRKLVTGIRVLEKLVDTPAMQKFGAEINPKAFPGCEEHFFDSYDYWECYIRHMTLTMFHPVGTCKMGNIGDPTTVVTKNFKVKNVQHLFVVDASVLPKSPSANPHAIVSMLAHKFIHDMSTDDKLQR